jgi:hypothetical protein
VGRGRGTKRARVCQCITSGSTTRERQMEAEFARQCPISSRGSTSCIRKITHDMEEHYKPNKNSIAGASYKLLSFNKTRFKYFKV